MACKRHTSISPFHEKVCNCKCLTRTARSSEITACVRARSPPEPRLAHSRSTPRSACKVSCLQVATHAHRLTSHHEARGPSNPRYLRPRRGPRRGERRVARRVPGRCEHPSPTTFRTGGTFAIPCAGRVTRSTCRNPLTPSSTHHRTLACRCSSY